MITHFSIGENDSQIGNLMFASTGLVTSCIADREDWDIKQLTFLEYDRDRYINWRTHNVTKLEIGKCEDSVDSEDEIFTDVVRITTGTGDILFIEVDLVTTEPQEANFITIFEV